MIRQTTLRFWFLCSVFSIVNSVALLPAAQAGAGDIDDKNLNVTEGHSPPATPPKLQKKSTVASSSSKAKHPVAGSTANSGKPSNAATSGHTAKPAVSPTQFSSGAASSSDTHAQTGASSSSSTTSSGVQPKEAAASSAAQTSINPGSADKEDSGKSVGSLAAAENSFGFNTFSKLAASAEKNIFISPLSLHSCLHMIYNGAAGATASEMAKVLGFPPNSLNAENDQYGQLMSELAPAEEGGTASFIFSNANSLWANDNVKLKPAFADISKKVFGAEVRNLDFGKSDSCGIINAWVNEKTHGKIPKIIDELHPEQVLVAVNAAYFKARWKTIFDKGLTADADFTGTGGVKQVPMMDIKGDYNYLENDQFQAIELPYEGGKTSLVVMLPRESSSLPKLRDSLSSSAWATWTDKMESQNGELKLPRFTMHYEAQCKNVLEESGMKLAFDAKSDLSGIVESSAPTCLSEVVHKTFVKVDEEGTEAAAATATAERMLSMVVVKSPDPFKMVVNRPFLFAVMNWKTKAILFVGQCVNPSEG